MGRARLGAAGGTAALGVDGEGSEAQTTPCTAHGSWVPARGRVGCKWKAGGWDGMAALGIDGWTVVRSDGWRLAGKWDSIDNQSLPRTVCGYVDSPSMC